MYRFLFALVGCADAPSIVLLFCDVDFLPSCDWSSAGLGWSVLPFSITTAWKVDGGEVEASRFSGDKSYSIIPIEQYVYDSGKLLESYG